MSFSKIKKLEKNLYSSPSSLLQVIFREHFSSRNLSSQNHLSSINSILISALPQISPSISLTRSLAHHFQDQFQNATPFDPPPPLRRRLAGLAVGAGVAFPLPVQRLFARGFASPFLCSSPVHSAHRLSFVFLSPVHGRTLRYRADKEFFDLPLE